MFANKDNILYRRRRDLSLKILHYAQVNENYLCIYAKRWREIYQKYVRKAEKYI